MDVRLQKFLTVALLTLFLSSQITMGIHNYVHSDDFHCTANDAHIHKKLHHCSLCEYIQQVGSTPAPFDKFPEPLPAFAQQVEPYKALIFLSFPHYSCALRAPPVIF
jgi:hypothetical protein